MLLSLLSALLLTPFAHAQIELPAGNLSDRIVLAADGASHWTEGVYDVYLLRGNCYINQGLTYARSREAVVWIERGGVGGEPPHKVIAYLEGDVAINYQQSGLQGKAAGAATLTDKTWFGRFYSVLPVDVRPMKLEPPPTARPALYDHAVAARDPAPPLGVQKAQFAEPIAPPPPIAGPPPGMVRIRVQGRSAVKPDVEVYQDPKTNEQVLLVKSGVNIVVDGVDQFGSIDVDTDNLVIWTDGALATDPEGQSQQPREKPLEIYMEGNVVFRQGERTIYAQRMYYDVRRQTGIVLAAEILTPVQSYQGLLKLRADVIQQLGPDRFLAQNGSITSSRFGVPGYELRADLMTFDDVQQPRINPLTGTPEVDATGAPIIDHQRLATSNNNFLYVEQFPVFYWPFIATDLDKPNYYIDSIRVMNDKVFGTRVMTDLDAYQVFGIKNRLPGTKWELSADYFSKRGPGGGTTFNYERQTLFGVPASTNGFVDAWAINDTGLDNLGLNRRTLIPPRDFRGRVLAQHRQLLPNNFQLTGEFGYISDFNFLEEYFEKEWDQLKDQSTDLELKQYLDNSSWSVFGAARLDYFFTETAWLPRLDHFWLGEPLLGDRLTWYEHSSAGYAQMLTAHGPTDPVDAAQWGPLPWEGPAASTHQGERFATRQELDLPFSAGVIKFDPYVLGELAPLGRSARQQRHQPGLRRLRLARQFADVERQPRGREHAVQRARAGAQGDLRDRRHLRPEHAEPQRVSALRSDRRQRHRSLSPQAHLLRFRHAAARARAVRRTVLRRAPRPGQLGRRAVDRNRRRSVRRAARHPPALANQARADRTAAHRRLDRVQHRRDVVSQSQPRQLRPDGGSARLRLPLARRRSHDDCRPTAISISSSRRRTTSPSARSSTVRRAARSISASGRWKARSRATWSPRRTATA